jgi:hypothetical protein
MQNAILRASRKFLVPLILMSGFAATAASAADLGIVTTGPTTLTVGVAATFTHTATDYVFPLPPNVPEKIVSTGTSNLGALTSSGTGWTCGSGTCTRATAIAVNNSFPVVTVTVTPTAAGPFKICGTVSFTPNAATQPDQNAANNQHCVKGDVKPGSTKAPDVAIKKGISGTPQVPGTFHFVLATFNNGPGSVGSGGVKVVDTIDPNFAIGAINAPGWNCPSPSGQTVTCTYIGSPVGQSQPFPQIQIEVKPKKKGSYRNLAGITYFPPSGQSGETVLNNNSAAISFTVN